MIDTTSDWHAITTKGLKTGQKGLECLWMPITEDVGHIWGEIISQGAILGLSDVTFMHLFLKAILLQVFNSTSYIFM